MISNLELEAYLATTLDVDTIGDYCPNGMQVEGKREINTVVSGVTACQALIDAAIDANADAILVHHGAIWSGDDARIVGMKRKRIQTLLQHDVNLFGYHLPLDVHPVYGNNAQLGKMLQLDIDESVNVGGTNNLLWLGKTKKAICADEFAQRLATLLEREPLHIKPNADKIQTIAWCTGGAQKYIDTAIALQADAYISGEISENTYHSAIENNIHYYAAGHHATERAGAKALGEHVAEKFNLNHQFIDIPNPV